MNAYNDFIDFIPKDWSIYKLKYLINSLESGKRKDFEDETYAFSLGGEHINWDGTLNLSNERFLSKEFYDSMNKGKIEENDVLLVKDGATIGKTAFIDNLEYKMAVNEHVFIIRNNKFIQPKLLYYLISSNIGFSQIKLTETGSAQGGINSGIKDKVHFIIPNNVNEQVELVDFLDKKTSEIDENIAKNKELISLLEEKKTALINQVVTKGLDPNVPMKDSGIEWIGEIPEHWEIIKGKYIFKIFGNSISEDDVQLEYSEGLKPILYYKVDDMNYEKNSLYMSDEIDYKFSISTHQQVPEFCILIPKRGAAIATNKVKINTKKCYIDSNIMALSTKFDSKFYSYFILGRGLWDIADVSTIPQINNKHINYLPFVLPPIDEQKEISSYLESNLSKINVTISKIQENIDLLEEYKTSLIHHAVTGKIDVRDEI